MDDARGGWDQERSEDHLDRAESALEADDPEQAHLILSSDAAHRAGEPRHMWLLAWSALGTGRHAEASAAAERLAQVQAGAGSYLLLASCLIESARHARGRGRKAILQRGVEAARRSGEFDTSRPHPLYLLTEIYLLSQRLKDAIRTSDVTATAFPDEPDTWLWRSRVAYAARDYTAAQAAVDFALELDPLHAPAVHQRGVIMAAAGRSSDAMRQLIFAEALGDNSDLARQRMVAYGGRCFYVLCLLVTSPLAFIWPVWLVAATLGHRLLMRSGRTGPTMQRWSYGLAMWMSQRKRPRLLQRRTRATSPFQPIRRGLVSPDLLVVCGVLVSAAGLAMTIDLLIRRTTHLWPVVVFTDVTAITLLGAHLRRTRRDPGSILHTTTAA